MQAVGQLSAIYILRQGFARVCLQSHSVFCQYFHRKCLGSTDISWLPGSRKRCALLLSCGRNFPIRRYGSTGPCNRPLSIGGRKRCLSCNHIRNHKFIFKLWFLIGSRKDRNYKFLARCLTIHVNLSCQSDFLSTCRQMYGSVSANHIFLIRGPDNRCAVKPPRKI